MVHHRQGLPTNLRYLSSRTTPASRAIMKDCHTRMSWKLWVQNLRKSARHSKQYGAVDIEKPDAQRRLKANSQHFLRKKKDDLLWWCAKISSKLMRPQKRGYFCIHFRGRMHICSFSLHCEALRKETAIKTLLNRSFPKVIDVLQNEGDWDARTNY